MARKRRLITRAVALGFVLTAVVTAGCASHEDRAFTSAAMPVLVQAAGLESTTAIPLPTWNDSTNMVETDGQRALGDVKVFRLRVRQLPVPRRRELRYLRAKLERLGETAEGLVRAGIQSRASLMPHEPHSSTTEWIAIVHRGAVAEGMWRARFFDALLGAAVAERIATKSSVLTEEPVSLRLEGAFEGSALGRWSDSLMTEMERAARAEMGTEGR